MSDIIWPERYTPGTTDNYVSNEIIMAGLDAAVMPTQTIKGHKHEANI